MLCHFEYFSDRGVSDRVCEHRFVIVNFLLLRLHQERFWYLKVLVNTFFISWGLFAMVECLMLVLKRWVCARISLDGVVEGLL